MHASEAFTMAHEILILMGDLHTYNNCCKPNGPLTFKTAIQLIKLGLLVLSPLEGVEGIIQSKVCRCL